MALNSITGAGAYSAIANLVGSPAADAKAAALEQGGSEFGNIVDSVLANVTKSGKAMEAQAVNLSNGNADVLDLVTAVAETELAVESLVTIRDRVISAYQDILNMPI